MAAIALAACSTSRNPVVYGLTLIIIEVAANFVQYGAAFALLVQHNPKSTQRSITYLTLIAGFASTIFWPITTMLHRHLSWREVYMVFAGLNVIACLPLHFWLASISRKARLTSGKAASPPVQGVLGPGQRRQGFVLMVAGFVRRQRGHPCSYGATDVVTGAGHYVRHCRHRVWSGPSRQPSCEHVLRSRVFAASARCPGSFSDRAVASRPGNDRAVDLRRNRLFHPVRFWKRYFQHRSGHTAAGVIRKRRLRAPAGEGHVGPTCRRSLGTIRIRAIVGNDGSSHIPDCSRRYWNHGGAQLHSDRTDIAERQALGTR
jgi:hypothetical protein